MGLCIRKQDVDFSSFNVPLHSLTSQLLWGQAAAAGKSGCMVPSCGPGTGLSPPRLGTPRLVDPGSGPGSLDVSSVLLICLSGCFPSSGLLLFPGSPSAELPLLSSSQEPLRHCTDIELLLPQSTAVGSLQPHPPPMCPPRAPTQVVATDSCLYIQGTWKPPGPSKADIKGRGDPERSLVVWAPRGGLCSVLGCPCCSHRPGSGSEHNPVGLFPVPAGKGWVPASFPVCVTPRRSPAACPLQGGGTRAAALPRASLWLAGRCDPAPLPPGPAASPLPSRGRGWRSIWAN